MISPRSPRLIAGVLGVLGSLAVFAAPALAAEAGLKVIVHGPGSVSASEGAISGCAEAGGSCEGGYAEGSTITLFAGPTERSVFAGWEGCEVEAGAECTVTLDAATEVHANFTAIPQQKLTVATEGTGQGAVTGTSPGPEFSAIECGDGAAGCEAEYDEGATITLFAGRATHSAFSGWSGCETEAGTECTVTMAAAREVTAGFAAIPQQTLDLTVAGEGEVTSSPAGIACTAGGGTCSEHFDEEGPEATVTLFASPSADNHLEHWSGCETEAGDECTVTMSAAHSVGAQFAPTFHTLTVTPTGPGSLGASSGAIADCSSGGGTCADEYQEGATVTLTAAPAAHNHVSWSGCTVSELDPDLCEVTIGESDAGVEAAFQVNEHSLTVIRTGLGSVSASSGAIAGCSAAGGTCAGTYDETAIVILTATPAAHRHVAWEAGDCRSERGPGDEECEVEIGASDSAVEVAFPANTQTLTVIPSGQGSVRANSGAISHCSAAGGTCSGTYIEAATVTLTATPGAGQAVTWSGCTALPGPNTCEVEIGAAEAVVRATFATATGPNPAPSPSSPPLPPSADTRPPSNAVKLGTATRHGSTLAVRLTVPGPGILSASGKDLRTYNAAAGAAGPRTLHLKLTSAGRKLLTRKGKLALEVTVTFTPTGGSPGTTTKTLIFRAEH